MEVKGEKVGAFYFLRGGIGFTIWEDIACTATLFLGARA
jgi:hypothetical protein